MEKRFNFNTEVDNMSQINEFFQNYTLPSAEEVLRNSEMEKELTVIEQ
jgi:hypothetical protein